MREGISIENEVKGENEKKKESCFCNIFRGNGLTAICADRLWGTGGLRRSRAAVE